MKKFILALLLIASPAFAQWQTPDHSVPIGNGGGMTGFNNAAPGAADLPLLSNGPAADPSFRVLPNAGLASAPATTVKCNPTGGVAVEQDCTATQLRTVFGLQPVAFSNTFTVDHAIATTDCNGAVQMGSGSSYPLTLTLPSVAGFTGPCPITIVGQTSRGVKLSGFAALGLTSPSILWPQKSFSIAIANGAWVVTRTDGRWQFPAAAGSPFPAASITYTINIGGGGSTDLNDGLAAGSGAFATLQAAVNAAAQYFDLNGQVLIFQLADGTYSQANSIHLWSLVGQSVVGGHLEIIIRGNVASPGNVVVEATGAGAHAFAMVGLNTPYRIEGVKFKSTSGACISIDGWSFLYLGKNDYNVCPQGHVSASYKSFVEMFPPYTISASTSYHISAGGQSQILLGGGTVTLTGAPVFSTSFAVANNLSYLEINNTINTFSGAATGTRFVCGANSIIQTFGGGAAYFPGNVAGTTPNTGCLYQ